MNLLFHINVILVFDLSLIYPIPAEYPPGTDAGTETYLWVCSLGLVKVRVAGILATLPDSCHH